MVFIILHLCVYTPRVAIIMTCSNINVNKLALITAGSRKLFCIYLLPLHSCIFSNLIPRNLTIYAWVHIASIHKVFIKGFYFNSVTANQTFTEYLFHVMGSSDVKISILLNQNGTERTERSKKLQCLYKFKSGLKL